jgi:hypothetical protein
VGWITNVSLLEQVTTLTFFTWKEFLKDKKKNVEKKHSSPILLSVMVSDGCNTHGT